MSKNSIKKIILNRDFNSPYSNGELSGLFPSSEEFVEAVASGCDGEVLTIFFNAADAHLILTDKDGSNFQTLNLDASENSRRQFKEADGKINEVAAEYLLSRAEGIKALYFFAATGKVPPEITLEEM